MTDLLTTAIALLLLGIASASIGAHLRERRRPEGMASPPRARDPRRRPPGLDSEKPEIVLATAMEELALAEGWICYRRDLGDPGADRPLLHIRRALAAINRVVLRDGEVPE